MSELQPTLTYKHHPFEAASLSLFKIWSEKTGLRAEKNLPEVKRLSLDQMREASHLIDRVRSTLSIDETHFLKPKSVLDLIRLDRDGGAVFGFYNEDQELVALTVAERSGEPTISPAFNAKTQATVLLQSVCTREDYRKRGVLKEVFAEITRWATEFETPVTLIAKVAADNHKSLQLFANNGFTPVHTGWDPEKSYAAHIMGKTVDREAQGQNLSCSRRDYAL